MEKQINTSETHYHKYEYLAKHYANKIWNEHNLGLEKEDIIQELRLRLFIAINSHAKCLKTWEEYNERIETGWTPLPAEVIYKPVPIEYYLKSVMINKSRDFIKEINKTFFVRTSEIDFDFGNDDTTSFTDGELTINGFNILGFLKSDRHKKIVRFHLKGMELKKIKLLYKNFYDGSQIDKILKSSLEIIRTNLKTQIEPTREYVYQNFSED